MSQQQQQAPYSYMAPYQQPEWYSSRSDAPQARPTATPETSPASPLVIVLRQETSPAPVAGGLARYAGYAVVIALVLGAWLYSGGGEAKRSNEAGASLTPSSNVTPAPSRRRAGDDDKRDYVARWRSLAESEERRTGVPANITLAQGLLESDAGFSELALKTKNHFGKKCFDKRCPKGHCENFADDTHKDFFVKYSSIEASFRAHSDYLLNAKLRDGRKRYAPCFAAKSEKEWCVQLRKCGYATDPKYSEKLYKYLQDFCK